ncbi:hypothetical protein FACS189432_02020 [Bacteroidia bacterium]|nr:hypothetical protein FACS189432_02020 [Bacteroidia bacterium]
MHLTTFHSQFRAIGVNYNQIKVDDDHAKVLFTSRMIEPASGNYEKGDIKSPMHPSGSPDLSFPKFERIQSPALLI